MKSIENEQLKTIVNELRQITDMLLLQGTLTECPGLVHGKMGIAIFFFHYAQYTGNELFADYAMDLINEILEQIHVNNPANYETGIAGIGVGIDYLIRNDFLTTEDDICEDIDQRMVRALLYDPLSNFSQYDGLTGYGRYWVTRFFNKTSSKQAQKCLFYIIGKIEEQLTNIQVQEKTDVYCFLHDLCQIQDFEACNSILRQLKEQTVNNFSRLCCSYVGTIVQMYQQNRYFNFVRQNEINVMLTKIPGLDMEKIPVSTGLLNGYAGEGMIRLTTLEPSIISWMNLL